VSRSGSGLEVQVLRGSPLSHKDLGDVSVSARSANCGDFCGDSPAISRKNFAPGSFRTNSVTRPRAASQRPRDAFLHAKPWQFGRDGRKFKIVAERSRRVARVLARFGSDDCRSIFPSVDTILTKLRAAETHFPVDGAPWARRMSWSRRTVLRYLRRLERIGISVTGGLRRERGTRCRALNPAKLLSFPRESGTRSKSLDSKKLQLVRAHGRLFKAF
jgi:hypothetical protein